MTEPASSGDEQLRVRTVGGVTTGDGDDIQVDHVFTMETCEHGYPEPGEIGLTIVHAGQTMSVLFSPDDALVIANRLQRAANLVMESGEALPDPEREYRRHSGPGGDRPDEP